MKRMIFAAFTMATLAVADDDLVKTTTCMTNGQRVVTMDAYVRAGLTNLTVKTIAIRNEGKTYRIQNVYRNGKLVMDIWDMGDGLIISAKAQSDCNAGTHFTTNGSLAEVNLMDSNLMTLDHFTVTNGVLFPVSSAVIKRGNGIGTDIKKLFDPAHMGKLTPEEFGREASDLKKKHQKE